MNAPAIDESLTPELASMFAAEARVEFKGDLVRFAILAVLALALATAIPFARTMMHEGSIEVATGTLVDIRRYANERRELGIYAFVDRDGRKRQTTSSMKPGEFAIGDIVDVIYSLDDETFSRPVNSNERYARGFFIVMTVLQSTFALGVLAWASRRYRMRVRLARHGVARRGASARLVERQVPIPNMPRQWRLATRHFDAARAEWRDVVSSWRDAPAPTVDGNTRVPPTLFDPDDSRRHWQPLGWLAPELRR